ncbi:MAG: hypothetical protein ACREJP_10060 [Candidatus Methylomirabilales bacterium]
MKPERVVIADFEAGVGTMLRANADQVDLAVVVVEPYMKSIDAARRLIQIARENGIERCLLVANKVRDEDDLALIRTVLEGREPDFIVPADHQIAEADLYAEAPIDRNPGSPAVRAIQALAGSIGGVDPPE